MLLPSLVLKHCKKFEAKQEDGKENKKNKILIRKSPEHSKQMDIKNLDERAVEFKIVQLDFVKNTDKISLKKSTYCP